MGQKLWCGIIAMLLMLAFLGPMLIKLKEVDLTIVILIGVAMMVYDFWESLKEKDS
jgi:hypothetical protein